MDFAGIVRNGIALADSLLKDGEVSVTWEAWISQDVKGKPTYASPVTLRGILDATRRQRYIDGRVVTVVATLTILDPVTPNGTAGRHEPIDVRDRIILPDGTSGPIMSAPSAVWDSVMNRPFLNEILIGEPGQII